MTQVHAFSNTLVSLWVVGSCLGLGVLCSLFAAPAHAAENLDLAKATIVTRGGDLPSAEKAAATVLAEEVQARTGLAWTATTEWPSSGPVIALALRGTQPAWPTALPQRHGADLPETRPEGYRLWIDPSNPGQPIVWIIGADARGTLFGAGHLLRALEWSRGAARLPLPLDVATAPVYAIRGHQLGYRNTANSYDAWSVAQYDQHIRELVLFGANCIENIPDKGKDSPHMAISREEMNIRMSAICQRYGIDYWVWVPVLIDLTDNTLWDAELEAREALFAAAPQLDAVFVPGGDPGDNHPDALLPFAEKLAARLNKHHPQAKLWISLQGFEAEKVDAFHDYVDKHLPPWLGGVVAGPSSPQMDDTRKRLPERYPIRHYPDITHSLICQYPTYWWDQAFALTLGREGPNPQPAWYTHVHNWFAPYTDGFLTYSDGMHDDVNKAVWSRVGWDPETKPRTSMLEYTRFFFGAEVAEDAADAILALEKNWEGSLANNGAVDATLLRWQDLETRAPELAGNWRWQLCLLRAYYDAYTRHRLIHETALEEEMNALLAAAETTGSAAAMDAALAVLARAETEPPKPAWRARIEALCKAMFKSIGFQTSVERYQASGGERGAILDYVDRPLNNRWWLEDEFDRIRALSSESDKIVRLHTIASWETPGPGSYYDDIGNPAQMPHVTLPPGPWVHPDLVEMRNPHYPWTEDGFSRRRTSWLCFMRWPESLVYRGVDPTAGYVLRFSGPGDVRPRVNGELLKSAGYSKELGEFKDFPVPRHLLKDRQLELTFDDIDESHLNWRKQSYLAEVWLLKQ